jgi:hypothetical protein
VACRRPASLIDRARPKSAVSRQMAAPSGLGSRQLRCSRTMSAALLPASRLPLGATVIRAFCDRLRTARSPEQLPNPCKMLSCRSAVPTGHRWLGSTTIRHFSANADAAAGDLRRIRF